MDFPSEGNSQGEILGLQVTYFQQRNFVQWQCCRKLRLNTAEKSDVHQGCQALSAYLVDILWFAIDQFRISVFYCHCFGLEYTYIGCFIAFEGNGVVESATCLSVVDIIVNCLFSIWHNPSVFVQDVVERD
jgi:hypothetical protein